jgi:hypothetical protein
VTGPTADDAVRHPGRTAPDPAPPPARRALLGACAAAGLGLAAGCGGQAGGGTGGDGTGGGAAPGSGKGAGAPSASSPPARRRPGLPRGGRELFPRYRLVGYCGLPGAAPLGRLGTGDPAARVKEIEERAGDFARDREPLPVLELLATVTNADPGRDGRYRTRVPDSTIRRFHELAREHRALLLLNVQPGRSSAQEEVEALSDWLAEPDVGLALDPEWDMGPGEVPGETYGSTSGAELNRIAARLSGLVREHDLPEKPFVFHQVAVSVVPGRHRLRPAPGVALIKSADGIGSPGMKRHTWQQLVRDLPDGVHTGVKLFFDEDAEAGPLMTPQEVLALRPTPEYVMYE